MTEPILAAHAWPTNGALMADISRLGYLRVDAPTLDPTYGKGNWWTEFRPDVLLRHDINPDKAPDGVMDFRALDYPDGRFEVVVFDPPYVAPGGRKTSTIKDMHAAYGMDDAGKSPADVQHDIDVGLAEMVRVTRRRGRVLVKCMNYTSGGKLWPGVHNTVNTGWSLGLRLEAEFVHETGLGPQPTENLDGTPRVQRRPRNNYSTLLVFVKP